MTLGATELEQALGYRFVDSSLLAHALVHRSYSKDFPEAESNERLEYLGDAVLGWVVADFTYRDPESFPEGRLTDIRKTVVNTNALATVARLPEIPAGIAVLTLLWLYVQVTGASPSSVRAWIMAAFLWGGRVGERDTPALQSLALACAVTLLLSPEACADAGFQLSYAAVLGIIVAGGPAAELCARPTEEERLTPATAQTARQRLRWRARKFLLGGLCVSLAATLAGAPLTLGHFGTASWGGVFVNLVLVPLSEIPLMLGMASVACGVSDGLATPASWLNGIAGAWLHAMTWIAQACATLPGLNLELVLPYGWLGPLGATSLATAFLAQAQSKSLSRLLGVPVALLAVWMLLVILLRVLS